MPNVFVDTNVLLYAVGGNQVERRKTLIARKLLLLPKIILSVQVLNEFYVNAINPRKLALHTEEALLWCDQWKLFKVADLTLNTFNEASRIHIQMKISHWDALILASAKENGCSHLYSEDLKHGEIYAGVRVQNPFHRD